MTSSLLSVGGTKLNQENWPVISADRVTTGIFMYYNNQLTLLISLQLQNRNHTAPLSADIR